MPSMQGDMEKTSMHKDKGQHITCGMDAVLHQICQHKRYKDQIMVCASSPYIVSFCNNRSIQKRGYSGLHLLGRPHKQLET